MSAVAPAMETDPGWPDDAVEVGRIVGAWGVKGWFKVQPFAAEPQALFSSRRWHILPPDDAVAVPATAPTSAYPSLLQITGAKAHGDRLASDLGRELISIAARSAPQFLSPDAAITAALRAPGSGPVVIADTTDNAGGGAPSDNTTFIHKLIAAKVSGAAVAPVALPCLF